MTRARIGLWCGVVFAVAGFALAASPLGHAAGKTRTVKVEDFLYKPAKITVKKGTKIRWNNKDRANHTVTFTNGRKGLSNLTKLTSGTLTFNKPGTYKYVCDFHPAMHGTVVVKR